MNNTTQAGLLGLSLISLTSYAQQPSQENSKQHPLEQITVISSGVNQAINELSASVSVLDEDDLLSRYQLSVADSLRTLAGVSVSNSGGTGKTTALRIRGEEGFRTRLYLDGVELSDPTAPQVTPLFDDILQSDIASITLLRGPQGLIYGADAGGVINIQTESARSGVSGTVAVEMGSYGTRRLNASVNLANDSSSVYLSASDFQTDSFNAQAQDVSGEEDPYDNQTFHLNARHRFSDTLSIQAVVRQTEGGTQYDGCFDNITFALINNCTTETEQTSARLSGSYITNNASHHLGYAITDVNKAFFNDNLFGFSNDGEITRLDYLGTVQLDKQAISFGVDLKEEQDNNANLSRYNRGYFAEWLHQGFDRLTFNLGLRYDDNETFGSFTSWRSGINYQFPLSRGDKLLFKSTYGTGFRASGLFEQAYNDGPFAFGDAAGLQLTEEESHGYDIGLVYHYASGTFWELTWFDQEIDDEIIFDGVGYQGYLQAPGTSQSQGIEFSTETQLGQSASLWFNYTYTDSEDQAGNQRLRRPEQMANLGIQYHFLNEKLRWSVVGHFEKGAEDIGNAPLDTYVLWSTNLRYDYSDNVQVLVWVNNVLDKEYVEVIGFNTAERQGGVKVSLSF